MSSLMDQLNKGKGMPTARPDLIIMDEIAEPVVKPASTEAGKSALAALQAEAGQTSPELLAHIDEVAKLAEPKTSQVKPLVLIKPQVQPKPSIKPQVRAQPISELTINGNATDVVIPQEGDDNQITVLPANDMVVIQTQLIMVREALEETPIGDVAGHMNVLQAELQGTEYLVDMLEPEDLGLMVLAQRKLMETDILAKKKPKSRAKPKKVVVPKATAEEMLAVSAGDFAV